MGHLARDNTLEEIVDHVAREEQYIRMGTIGPEDYVDPETGEEFPTVAEEAIKTLGTTIKRIRNLRTHSCQWSDNDYCMICGVDGRA